MRYVYCNKEGEKNAQSDDDDDGLNGQKRKRRRVSRRFGCKARLVLQFSPREGYVVKTFIEQHTHILVSDAFKKYLKANMKLDYVHQKFILNCARVNIGLMRCYKLFKESVAYVIGVDAQMMIDKFFMKRELCSAFYFAYDVNGKDQLARVFWADPIAQKNYSIFGDIVSFDATYETNRYKMIFTPFTGLNNHGKCVTFGAALLNSEDIEAYAWALSKFKDCMGQAPRMIITDQDPALRVAIERSLEGTRHRLCLWHIMLKIPEKVPPHLRKDESFTQRFNALVWSDLIEPLKFEKKWGEIMSDYGLESHSWFISMYGIRQYWIPAYFRDFHLSGLFRTTSPSESVNSFYSGFLNKNINLVGFLMQFESALDSQRHTNERLNGADESTLPQTSTPLLFEKDAATIYTSNIFFKLQKDIEAACYVCSVEKIVDHDSTREFWVNDFETGVFTVVVNKVDSYATCSCKKFVRLGLLCSHVFVILKDLKITTIPTEYVVSRWTKNVVSHPIHVLNGQVAEQMVVKEENKLVMNQLISEFYRCLAMVDGNKDKMTDLLRGIRDLQQTFSSDDNISSSASIKKKLFDQYYDSNTPTEVSVLPPNQVKTKGSGRRLKPGKEKDMERKSKPPRMCNKCKQMSYHDARNCGRDINIDE
ncbi:hypothetical protein C2S51_020439 [Perilla frutescens var. frutescens]|nr:hypothetical protein C2S51_020439 [Perilla frutescens var. frutescens]